MPKAGKITVKGKFCSPFAESKKTSSGESCYNKQQLQTIIDTYNSKKSNSQQINVPSNATKKIMWDAIQTVMLAQCDNEVCWAKKLNPRGVSIDKIFRPIRPADKNEWLSTTHIRDVLKQYEAAHSNFVFLGPVPMDFCNLAGNEVCNIDLKALGRDGVTKVGIVYNTDPSTDPGKHWVSMFIDIEGGEIGYFDSYGMAPLAPQIIHLVELVQKQYLELFHRPMTLSLNCSNEICSTTVQHQEKNTECGVYSINFIVERLTGKSWAEIVIEDPKDDEYMTNMRKVFFRPTKGSLHPY
jgi:hypothetical protein